MFNIRDKLTLYETKSERIVPSVAKYVVWQLFHCTDTEIRFHSYIRDYEI